MLKITARKNKHTGKTQRTIPDIKSSRDPVILYTIKHNKWNNIHICIIAIFLLSTFDMYTICTYFDNINVDVVEIVSAMLRSNPVHVNATVLNECLTSTPVERLRDPLGPTK